MKIVIPGGSGQVGTVLARHFHSKGHEVVELSRSPRRVPWTTRPWDAKTLGDWTSDVNGADVVVNLAGRSVNCRYNAANRGAIMASRVDSTRVVGEAIGQAENPPRVWLQSSTATIYAHRYDAPNDEATGIIGGDEAGAPATWRFSIDVAKAWERTLDEAVTPSTRKVALRSAMTMSPDKNGIFDTLLGMVRKGLGGSAAGGKQYVSWIHDADFIRAIEWLIERDDVRGPVNLAAPNPLPYSEFMKALRKAAGMPIGLPATRWMLEIGAVLMRTETELVLKSRRVVPGRLMDMGFEFEFAEWSAASRDLVNRWKRGQTPAGASKAPNTSK